MTMVRTKIIFLVCSVLLLGALGALQVSVAAQGSACTQTLTAGANLASAVSSAASGATICLGAGSYTFNATISKSSMTKVTAAAGVDKTQVTINPIALGSSNNLWFDNVTAGPSGNEMGGSSTSATNIRLTNIRFTGSLCINAHVSNSNVLVDSSTFIGVGQSCGEGRITVMGGSSGNNGVTISNTEFSGGNSDAIQLVSGARGTVIGPGNYFHDITNCSVHCDAIQPYGANNTTITGNYFKNLDGIIADFDCNGSPMFFTNNVFDQGSASAQAGVAISGANGDTFIHNTFSSTTELQIYGGNQGCSNSNVTVRNNVIQGGCSITGSGHTISNNLYRSGSCGGTSAITGSATYVGGANPATWAGFSLASGSLGKNAGNDGQDMGSNYFGGQSTSPPPAPPTNVRVVR